MKAISIRITGRVQGVGFRYFVFRLARKLGVNGIVRNCSNGDVYIEAESSESILTQFVEECSTGPSRSEVLDVHLSEIGSKDYSDFEITG
ncbi:MAG: acylphosphatase [Bacteroidales bacterium]